MGTLFDQGVRNRRRINSKAYLEEVVMICEDVMESSNISMDQALRAYEIAEYIRRTDVMVDDMDIKDEQLGGFGELVKELIEALKTH